MRQLLRILLLALLLPPAAAAEPPLVELPVGADPATVTISGISSGAAMALQAHIALSAKIRGVAAFAGFVYGCGRGDYATLRRCAIAQNENDIALNELLAETRRRAEAGLIDPLAGLAKSRVYLFSGANDPLILPVVSRQIRNFYRALLPAGNEVVLKEDPLANHAWSSPDAEQGCADYGGNWINNCGDDPQAEFLTLFYGPLQKRASAPLRGRIVRFAQTPLIETESARKGLAETAYAFIPPACDQPGNGCRVHLALHGCMMSAQALGDTFVRQSGLNPWAENNRIIVVYPQARPSDNNPRACWDIWGIHDPDYDTRQGGQMRFLDRLIEHLTQKP